MTKEEREKREFKSLYSDEKYAKQAWKNLIGKSLQSPAKKFTEEFDAKGNPIITAQIYNMAYDQVLARLRAENLSREPEKAEVLIEANIIRAAFDNPTFNTILDRTAGKVREEINVGVGQFEELSDEELELLLAHRQKKETERTDDE